VFVVDPSLGFPPGAPNGPPERLSWQGAVHGLVFAIGMLALLAAMLVFARRFAANQTRTWARWTLVAAVAFTFLAGVGLATGDFRITVIALTIGLGWATLTVARQASEAR
jgi:sulfite exporter TauE/SafE